MEILNCIVIKSLMCFIILSNINNLSHVKCLDDGESVRELPYCGPNNKSSTQGQKELVIVSTLDGRLSALDAANNGLLKWSVSTGPGPMLSSSIHRLELTNNGHWVRMIPSLSGGLYKFNGDSIEAIPITADTLLKSSAFLFSDDLVISGGKESRTYGVALKTGQVLYECSMKGCDNLTENISDDEEMLVVQRKTQTVRAVEVRTGGERWNFSVGLHDLKLMSDVNTNCHEPNLDSTQLPSKLELKVIVPEGLVCAVSKSGGSDIIWKHKFDSPIVTAWHLTHGVMRDVDLFSGSQWMPSQNKPDDIRPLSPTLYVGMHQKQLYIQESVNMQSLLQMVLADGSPQYPRLPWIPVPASSSALGLIGGTEDEEQIGIWPSDDTTSTTALSILYASEYVNGNGFYLFSEDILNQTKRAQCNVPNITIEYDGIENEEDMLSEGTPVQVIMVSLWHWWKEVLIISITTAAVVNLMINRNLINMINRGITREVIRKEIIVVEKHIPLPQELYLESNHKRSDRTNSESSQPPAPEYISRYLTDFHQVNCLGKGGFGVVFEAKNKIDDCHYAIKRIALPNKQESRDRVLREVKALAKLEHTNIVRYFNAWLECPPPGWEDEQNENAHSNSFVEEGYSSGNADQSKSFLKSTKLSVNGPTSGDVTSCGFANVAHQTSDSSMQLLQWKNNFSTLISSKLPENRALDKSDSYIVFEAPESDLQEKSGVHQENIDESVISMASSSSGSELKSVSTWQTDRKQNQLDIVKLKTHKRPASLDFSQSITSSLTPPPTRVYLFIQMQLCRKESLREWLLENTTQRDTLKVLQIFEQIVQAVEYVHLQGLIHRDLKPSNIFFSPDGQIKVGDFGLVTAMVENGDEQRTPSKDTVGHSYQTHTAQVGTQLYMSPEQLMGMCYNYKVDIYSLGLILFELLVPFNTQMERGRTLTDLRRNKFPQHFPQSYQQEYEILRLMLSHNPEDRPTTFGIRAKPPLCQSSSKTVDEQWHFELPQRRDSSKSSLSNSSSVDSSSWEQVT